MSKLGAALQRKVSGIGYAVVGADRRCGLQPHGGRGDRISGVRLASVEALERKAM
ncbi:MAG: hypothetical protein HC837_19320 [Chloroflexaceae bacterium]|nr:hypothetical protein [Chloroflexaceae bacterium]